MIEVPSYTDWITYLIVLQSNSLWCNTSVGTHWQAYSIELVFKPLNLYYIVGAFKVIHSTIGVFQTDEIFT